MDVNVETTNSMITVALLGVFVAHAGALGMDHGVGVSQPVANVAMRFDHLEVITAGRHPKRGMAPDALADAR